MSKKTKIMMEAVFYTSWWMIWWFRNSKIFKAKAPKKACFFDELQTPIEVFGKQTAYTIQSVRHQPGPVHPNIVYYLDSDEKKSSDSTTYQSDHSLSEYEAFCFDIDHMEEKSSGSTTSHYDFSLLEFEPFHFDLLIDQFPPADRSDLYHEEFADELAHIISLPEYDRFYFDFEDDPVIYL
nr:RNA-directed DNA polymerase, eukaryota [Tanacetum cinerariifolium]